MKGVDVVASWHGINAQQVGSPACDGGITVPYGWRYAVVS